MKYIKSFNESTEEEDEEIYLIEDFLLWYIDKWRLAEQNKYIKKMDVYDKREYNGIYRIKKSPVGHIVTIYFLKKMDVKELREFKKDMEKFAQRVGKSGYNYEVEEDVHNGISVVVPRKIFKKYYITFFK